MENELPEFSGGSSWSFGEGERMIQSGDVLAGQYQILNEIGSGGTGIIYLAMHLHLRKKVVVKKIKDHFVGQVNARAEVDILKNLHYTNLPQVYDFLVIDSSINTGINYQKIINLRKICIMQIL